MHEESLTNEAALALARALDRNTIATRQLLEVLRASGLSDDTLESREANLIHFGAALMLDDSRGPNVEQLRDVKL